jgi:hypothetical protein
MLSTTREVRVEWSPTIGVSAIVVLRERRDDYAVGTVGMVINQRPDSRYRYQVMIPGDPMAQWFPAEQLRLVQGVEQQTWWHRQPDAG